MTALQSRLRQERLLAAALVNPSEVNAAYLLHTDALHSANRSRVEALVGRVDESLFNRICPNFKWFMSKLRRDETDCVKRGERDEFYRRKFSCESVFGNSSLCFAPGTSIDSAPSSEEISKVISNGISRFANACLDIPSPPTTPVDRSSVSHRRWQRTRTLNTMKRKTISDLRAKISGLHFTIALLKRKGTRTPPTNSQTSGNRKELEQLRRELEYSQLEIQSLRDRIDSLQSEHKVITKEKGRYSTEFHNLVIHLMANGIPDSKICPVIREVASFLHRSLSDYPSLSTIRNDAMTLLGLTMQQAREVLDEVVGENNLTLISDETTKRRYKMQTYLVNLERDESGSKVFCLGIPVVHVKTARESLEALKGRMNRIELCTSGTVTGQCLIKLVGSISSAMSDRATTQTCFNKLLENFKRDIIPTLRDDWDQLSDSEREAVSSIHSLYCQLHIAASITDVFMRVVGQMEGMSGDDCTLLWVLKTFASHFSDRGSGKFQQLSKWLAFLDGLGVDTKHCILPSFDGQRFCIAFAIAARVFFLRDHLVEYITRFCSDSDTLCKARDSLSSPLILGQLRAASLVDSFVSGPLIRLSEHTSHVCATSTYIGEMIEYLTSCEANPTLMISFTPPRITVGDQARLFDLNSPYLQATVVAPHTPEVLTSIPLICSEIRLFLEVQYTDFLPGGCYYSPSQSLVNSLRNAPSTSRAAERTFGMIDHLFVKSPNCRMYRREGVVMSRMNGTMEWLKGKPLDVQARVLQSALEMRKTLERVSGEEKVKLAEKIRDDLLEKEEEARKREQRAFDRNNAVATVIATETGYWRTVEAMDIALGGMSKKGEKIRALTYQIQYRKSTLKQPPTRPGIFVIKPKGMQVTVERLRSVVEELIGADLAASSGKRVAPDWKGRRVERLVRNNGGAYTLLEGMVEEIEDVGGVIYVKITYDDSDYDTILLEELEEEIESGNAKFLGKRSKK